MLHLLTAIGFTPGGSSTVHIYKQTIHRTTQLIWKDLRAVYGLCELNPGICLTTEEKARENLTQSRINLSQGRKTSVRVEKLRSG
jgi:hypothetical protein